MGSIDRATRFRVLAAAGFRCQYCGRRAPDVVLEVDHVVPASRGGSNRRANLRAACFDCNRGKRADTLPEPVTPHIAFADVAFCTDSCVKCPDAIALRANRPTRIEWARDETIVLRYRCELGHEWQTSVWVPTALGVSRELPLELDGHRHIYPPLTPAEVARFTAEASR